VNVLGGPGGSFAEWLVPPGHDAAYFLGGAAVSILVSLIFCTLLAWVVVSLPVWWRDRIVRPEELRLARGPAFDFEFQVPLAIGRAGVISHNLTPHPAFATARSDELFAIERQLAIK
jgi:hypothetical protein